jgi:cyclopropane fatty-acyl-phospholipid synthase-like methyltransferase
MVERLTLHREFPKWLRCAHHFLVSRMVRSFECYQPVRVGSLRLAPGERACEDRWQLIERVLTEQKATTLLDLGCAEGYFVQRAARDRNVVSFGVDADIRRLTVASQTQLLNKVRNCAFMYSTINADLLSRLPEFDVILFLSVLHHVLYSEGLDYSLELMRAIRKKTRRYLIFDMGQSNEIEHSWSALLPDMGRNPAEWIADFLHRAGFFDVEVLGYTDAYKGSSRRLVFGARPVHS